MIQDYELTKNTVIRNGKADIHFAVEAKGVPIEDAKSAGDSFDLFLKDIQSEMPDGGRTRRRIFTMYNDKEMKIIQDAPDFRAAWDAYHAAFPKSPRTYDAIRKQWNKQHAVAEDPSPAPSSETRHKPATNDGPIPPAQSCNNVRKVAKNPGKKASSKECINFKKDRHERTLNRWSDEEKTAVDTAKDVDAAWTAYQELPNATRNRNAVKQRWEKVQRLKKKISKKKPKTARHAPPDQISAGKPQNIKVKDLTITEEPIEPKKGGPDKVDTSSVPRSDNVTAPDQEDGKDPDPKTTRISRGMQVRYIGSHPHVAFQGLKEVKRVNDRSGEALIDIGRGIEWIPTRDLAVVA